MNVFQEGQKAIMRSKPKAQMESEISSLSRQVIIILVIINILITVRNTGFDIQILSICVVIALSRQRLCTSLCPGDLCMMCFTQTKWYTCTTTCMHVSLARNEVKSCRHLIWTGIRGKRFSQMRAKVWCTCTQRKSH